MLCRNKIGNLDKKDSTVARTLARFVGESHFVKMWSWDFAWCGGTSDAKMSDKVSQADTPACTTILYRK